MATEHEHFTYDEEHFRVLQEGVETWNEWRKEERGLEPTLRGAPLAGADLSGADLRRTDLREADLRRSDLEGADLRGADLRRADLTGANLRDAFASGADLRRANLRRAGLRKTDLMIADLSGADLSGANLRGADLSGADLRRVVLERVDLGGADLGGAILGWTTFGDTDLRATRGLEMVQHLGPSTIGIDTVYRSGGEIPESFLWGAGVPQAFVDEMPALVGETTLHDSSLVVYCDDDELAANRVRADLRARGVPCWMGPADLELDERIRQDVGRTLTLHDRVVLIVSEHSAASEWIEPVLQAVRDEESLRGEAVLIPVHLDDGLEEIEATWAESLLNEPRACDFRRWEDPEGYEEALEVLLDYLSADGSSHSE